LFLNHIAKISEFTDEKYHEMYEIVNSNPKVLSSQDLLKQNRCVSYMTFFLKEIYDYMSLKTNDGVPIYNLRRVNNRIIQMSERIEYLHNLLITQNK
jgi:hypothetical protein